MEELKKLIEASVISGELDDIKKVVNENNLELLEWFIQQVTPFRLREKEFTCMVQFGSFDMIKLAISKITDDYQMRYVRYSIRNAIHHKKMLILNELLNEYLQRILQDDISKNYIDSFMHNAITGGSIEVLDIIYKHLKLHIKGKGRMFFLTAMENYQEEVINWLSDHHYNPDPIGKDFIDILVKDDNIKGLKRLLMLNRNRYVLLTKETLASATEAGAHRIIEMHTNLRISNE